MSRSKWKGPYVELKVLKSFKKVNKKKLILAVSRNSSIIPKFIGSNFKVHTGNSYVEVTVVKEMVGHKFGEFSATRKPFSFKKKKKKR